MHRTVFQIKNETMPICNSHCLLLIQVLFYNPEDKKAVEKTLS